ncbi:hypothetical protein [Secundilactobacillus silagincola]|nr:hypothetical protein [Secundilactobacillus silagincola]
MSHVNVYSVAESAAEIYAVQVKYISNHSLNTQLEVGAKQVAGLSFSVLV